MRGVVLTAILIVSPVSASSGCDLSGLVGYTVIADKRASYFVDNGKRTDGFEGCDFDRIIAFEDGTAVRCRGYSYSYQYRPTAYLLGNGSSYKMCVGTTLFDVGPIR